MVAGASEPDDMLGSEIPDWNLRSFEIYPLYRNSEIEGLEEIPDHWQVKRLKYLATVNDEVLAETTNPNLEIAYVDIGNVDSVEGITGRERLVFEDAPSRARRIVREGDVIVSTVRTYLRAIARIKAAEANLIVSTGLAVVRPRHLDGGFIAYALGAPYFVERVVAHSVGVSYPAIGARDLACLDIAFPPLAEQRAIVAFLDRVTAKIDALVAKKRRLIELLEEKRVALISRAVTKGLDPQMPVKDSGIEWLGEIPAHWEVRRLKTIAEIRYGLGEPPRESPNGLPLIRATNINSGHITDAGMIYVDPLDVPSRRRAFLSAHEIIVVRSGAYTADSSIVPRAYEGAIAGYDMVVTARNADPEFLATTLLCPYVRDAQLVVASTRSAQPHLNAEELGESLILLPPLTEQQSIVEFLRGEIPKLDALTAKIHEVVECLKELRTSLISSAVTGGIDVREEAA